MHFICIFELFISSKNWYSFLLISFNDISAQVVPAYAHLHSVQLWNRTLKQIHVHINVRISSYNRLKIYEELSISLIKAICMTLSAQYLEIILKVNRVICSTIC